MNIFKGKRKSVAFVLLFLGLTIIGILSSQPLASSAISAFILTLFGYWFTKQSRKLIIAVLFFIAVAPLLMTGTEFGVLISLITGAILTFIMFYLIKLFSRPFKASKKSPSTSLKKEQSKVPVATIEDVSKFVIKSLEEFGGKKWGNGNFNIYYYNNRSDFGVVYYWVIVFKQGVQYGPKAKPGFKEVYKHPCYQIETVVLSSKIAKDRRATFSVEYGGFEDYRFEADGGYSKSTDDFALTEDTLRKTLQSILDDQLEPSTILSFELERINDKVVI